MRRTAPANLGWTRFSEHRGDLCRRGATFLENRGRGDVALSKAVAIPIANTTTGWFNSIAFARVP